VAEADAVMPCAIADVVVADGVIADAVGADAVIRLAWSSLMSAPPRPAIVAHHFTGTLRAADDCVGYGHFSTWPAGCKPGENQV
jgi:hypothetical protein